MIKKTKLKVTKIIEIQFYHFQTSRRGGKENTENFISSLEDRGALKSKKKANKQQRQQKYIIYTYYIHTHTY